MASQAAKTVLKPLHRIFVRPPRRFFWSLVRFVRSLSVHPPEIARLERRARATSRRLVRRPDGAGWRSSRRPAIYLLNLAGATRLFLFGDPVKRYAIRQRHAAMPDPRPRVLHMLANVFVGGSTQLVVDLHEHLGHRFEMHVATTRLPPGGRYAGMSLHHLPFKAPRADIDALLARLKPDLVHVHYWGEGDRPWYEAVFAAALDAGLPVIENVNTPVPPVVDPRIRRYVMVSQTIRESFAPELDRVSVVHPGTDFERFRPPESWDPDAHDSVGMVYRLARDKLDESSLDALIMLAKRRPRTRIFVIGDGELFDPFQRRVRREGVLDNFAFTGTVPYAELTRYYSRFRIFVAPVVRESFGQVTPMAMAMGHAVAGNRVGALPEILGSNATLGRSPEELADILAGLLDDPVKTRALGRANMARAQAFSVGNMIARYREIYAQTLDIDLDLMPGFPKAELFEEV